jgi:curved DNA-binding protein CbpA
MDAFALLGVPPFLHADDAAFEQLKKRFSQLARAAHPDLVPESDEQGREEAEARSAALNAAWRSLKDFEGRLELALAAYPETEKPSKIAPEIASRYFEVQELLLEGDALARERLEELQAEVSARLAEEKARLHTIALRYTLKLASFESSLPATPWHLTTQDVAALRAGRNASRYLERLADDLEKNF